jgi:hypothetical protein
MLPEMIVRFYMGWFQMLVIDLPLIAASFWSISAFYVMAHRELYPKTWKRAFLFLPALMAAGVALTIINTRAVIEALVGYQTGFARTPKYAIESFNYLAIPFLLLFVGGYYWAGCTTLWEEYQGKLQWQRQRELAEVAEQAEA